MNHSFRKKFNRTSFFFLLLVVAMTGINGSAWSQPESAKEEDYFKIMRVPAPEGIILEVGGLCTLPNGDLGITTRRGDVFIVENPTSQHPYFRKFASGLHEVLGLAYKDGALYCAQRGELTKLVDANMDGKADIYETVYAWPITGNYHEYSYGPKIAADGSFFVTLNCTCPPVWWNMKSNAPWRGWALHIWDNGSMEPWAAGMRSPCGISMVDDELFYTDNQGDWVGSGAVIPVRKGAFMGHPASLVWSGMPNSPVKATREQVYAKNPPPPVEFDKNGQEIKPQNDPAGKILTEFEIKKSVPDLQLPAVWLPHGILGISNSEIVKIPEGTFGPFAGQLLVCDQGQSMIDRVFMEKINGEYQGAAWAFRSGFQSGIVRLAWAKDGSLFTGETNRGWGSAGEATEGVQRLVWNNRLPFEMRAVRGMPDGFEIEFTKPVNKKYAENLASYNVESFIYKYQAVYGSPPVNAQKCPVKGVKVSEDGMRARIIVGNLRQYYIHTINLDGIIDQENSYSLVHPTAYYTLNNIPEGKKLAMSEVSTKSTAGKMMPAPDKSKAVVTGKPVVKTAKPVAAPATYTFAMIKPLLTKYTCIACHNAEKRQVGPAYIDVAKRNYSIEKILSLIKNPQPQNWPGYSTPMAPMPQVPKEDATKIATWINSLKGGKK
ncbi:MAG: c-type cytochrome [Ferruginibacter sp.]